MIRGLRNAGVGFAVSLVAATLMSGAAWAHEYRTDGSIQVLLHTDPDDNAASNEQSQLEFYVFDSQNLFVGSHCVCKLTVTDGSQTVMSRAVFTDANADKDIALVPIVFPKVATYTVTLTGAPKPGQHFQAFRVSYPIDIAIKGGQQSMASVADVVKNGIRVGGVYLLVAVALIAAVVVGERRARSRRRSNG